MSSILRQLLMLAWCGQGVLSSFLRPNWLLASKFGVAGVNATFDYVIIGGGTAGLTIATRLAQDGRFSIAVVEAGGFYEVEAGNLSQVPAYAPLDSVAEGGLEGINPLVDWRFLTTPQLGAKGRMFHYARGKTLGGSSALNCMNHNRATVGAMQQWADGVGDDSYKWENVLPYYKRSAHFTPPNRATVPSIASIGFDAAAFAPDGGPLQVSYPNYIYAFDSWMRKAFSKSGLPVNEEGFDSGHLPGHQESKSTYDPADETRSSSQTSYLRLPMQETNLIVYTHSLVKKLVFDASRRATGVLVEAGGVPFQLGARKEVIVSAGAFQSLQLLMVSGVGPKSALEQYDIPVIADRQGVGHNMWA